MINNSNHFWRETLADSEETITLCLFLLITIALTTVSAIMLSNILHIFLAGLLVVVPASVFAVVATCLVNDLIKGAIRSDSR
jgi:hypothetical protein